MHARQGGHQAGIALIGGQADGTGVGQGKIGTRYPHVRLDILLAQFPAGHFYQAFDFGFLLVTGDLREQVRHLVARQVNGRHHHVGRALAAQLNDPLAQIGFGDLESLGFEIVVQEGFLGGHRLGFDDLFHIVVSGDAGDDRIGFCGCFGQMDVNARF